MSFQVEDIAQLLTIAAGVVSHPALTHGTLGDAQAQVKAFIADKEALQDLEILVPLDKILQYGAASQVPSNAFGTLGMQFDPSKYVDPQPPDEGETVQLPPPTAEIQSLPEEEPETEEPVAVEPNNGSVPEESNQ